MTLSTLNSFWKCFRILMFVKILIDFRFNSFVSYLQAGANTAIFFLSGKEGANDQSLKLINISMDSRILKHFQKLFLMSCMIEGLWGNKMPGICLWYGHFRKESGPDPLPHMDISVGHLSLKWLTVWVASIMQLCLSYHEDHATAWT